MGTKTSGPTKTFIAGAAIAAWLCCKITSGKLALAGASDEYIGVPQDKTFADGDRVAVRLRTAEGTIPMVASIAITAGAEVFAAANGKIAPTGSVSRGWAMEAATADGDVIEVLPR